MPDIPQSKLAGLHFGHEGDKVLVQEGEESGGKETTLFHDCFGLLKGRGSFLLFEVGRKGESRGLAA